MIETATRKEMNQEQLKALSDLWQLFLDRIENPSEEDDIEFHKRENVFEKTLKKQKSKSNYKRIEPEALIAEWHNDRDANENNLTTSQIIIKTFFELCAHHHPDLALIRFLTAAKWKPEKAFERLWRCLIWRAQYEVHRIFVHGEAAIDNWYFESGVTFFRNFDREERPIMVMSPGKYDKSEATSEMSKIFAIQVMETAKNYLIQSPAETVTLLVDLSGFGMNNFDFSLTKALIAYLDMYYCEFLGQAIVLNAPLVFSGVWRMISPLLDPGVVAKIHFAKKTDVEKYIDVSKILVEFGGRDSFAYKYIQPPSQLSSQASSVPSKDEDRRQKIKECQSRRMQVCLKFLECTKQWTRDHKSQKNMNDQRMGLVKELERTWWDLDQVAHEPGIYHRLGVVGSRGKLNK